MTYLVVVGERGDAAGASYQGEAADVAVVMCVCVCVCIMCGCLVCDLCGGGDVRGKSV